MLKSRTALIILVLLLLPLSGSYSEVNRTLNEKADFILVEKSKKLLTLFAEDNIMKTYRIALGGNPEGHKITKGDSKTPEGIYYIDSRNKNSRFHLALHISYPNEIDKFFAEKNGTPPGSNIMIHGIGEEYAWMGKYHTVHNWTDGCIAVTNEEIDEIWDLVPDGTRIEIRP